MKKRKTFSAWKKWKKRNNFPDIQLPGIYAIAFSEKNLSGKVFTWQAKEIVYIGMTNAKGGLKSRLQQFEYTIKGGHGHGGAHRVRHKHHNYDDLTKKLYVAICPYECDIKSITPSNLCVMGDIAKHEYTCLARYLEKHEELPEFNDKKRSPKK